MSLLPAYMDDAWRCYERMHNEDISSISPELVVIDPMTCHESVLPFLAWEMDVDISGVDIDNARSLIDGIMNSVMNAGTIGALKNSIGAIGVAKVDEWFEYSGLPFNFKLKVDVIEHGLSESILAKIESIALKKKNARSQMEAIEIYLLSNGDQSMGATIQSGETMTVFPYFPDPIEVSFASYYGGALHTIETMTVYPQGA